MRFGALDYRNGSLAQQKLGQMRLDFFCCFRSIERYVTICKARFVGVPGRKTDRPTVVTNFNLFIFAVIDVGQRVRRKEVNEFIIKIKIERSVKIRKSHLYRRRIGNFIRFGKSQQRFRSSFRSGLRPPMKEVDFYRFIR